MENLETRRVLGELAGELKEIVGVTRTFDGFGVTLNGDAEIVIKADSGWSMTYPPLCGPWMVLAGWLRRWDDGAEISMKSFVSIIMYPAAMMLHAYDDEYVNAVSGAMKALVDRADAEGLGAVMAADPVREETRGYLKGLLNDEGAAES